MKNILTGTVFFAAALLASSCRSDINRPDITPEMRDSYVSVSELYSAVWNPPVFSDPASREFVVSRLTRLIKDFHGVESRSPLAAFEPGFFASLRSHREMIVDIRSRYSEGSSEYASRRLRGIAGNCVACHTRFAAPVGILGNAPKDGSGTEQGLLLAQYYFAKNDFENAASTLEELDNFRAMQLWLFAQNRLKSPNLKSAAALESWLKKASLETAERAAVQSWIRSFRELENRPAPTTDALTQAQGLLNTVEASPSIENDNLHLVKTLHAATILQEIIQGMPLSERRRKALYLLSVAYVHTPIDIFEVLRDMYLEQTVREFPNSVEARRAFDILEDTLESAEGSSADLNLSRDQIQKLKQLRSLAYGRTPAKRPSPPAS